MKTKIDALYREDPDLIAAFGKLPAEIDLSDNTSEAFDRLQEFGRFELDYQNGVWTVEYQNAYD